MTIVKLSEDDILPPAPNAKAEAAAEQARLSYDQLVGTLRSLLKGERDAVANMANTAALVYHNLPDVNWAGFYRLVGEELVLGPFQGKPACVRIKPKKGVCGAAVAMRETLVVRNVHEFPGHIACDPLSNAELVVPIIKDGKMLGVFDLDSPTLGRFSKDDADGVERLVAVLIERTDLPTSW